MSAENRPSRGNITSLRDYRTEKEVSEFVSKMDPTWPVD